MRECGPPAGETIRSSNATAVRCEHGHPRSLVHMAVKTVGRVLDDGSRKAHGRAAGSIAVKKQARIGFDSVRAVVDDHTGWPILITYPTNTALSVQRVSTELCVAAPITASPGSNGS
jgi:hypothetical protein